MEFASINFKTGHGAWLVERPLGMQPSLTKKSGAFFRKD